MLIDRWGCCYWVEKYEVLNQYERAAGEVADGIFFIPPPLVAITYEDGLWSKINDEIGTSIDMAEDDEIEHKILKSIIDIISDFIKTYYTGDGIINKKIGDQLKPTIEPIFAEVEYKKIRENLQLLCDFLNRAKELNKTVSIEL